MNSASFETTFGSFTRLHEQNTYAAILATPCSVADIVAGDILWAATKSVARRVLRADRHRRRRAAAEPARRSARCRSRFSSGLTFAALGMIATARAGSYAFFDYYFTLGISLMVFFCGVFFPLASLPPWAQAVAWFLPLTHAVRLSRGLVAGAPSVALAGDVAWLVIVAVAGFVVAERLVRRRLIL